MFIIRALIRFWAKSEFASGYLYRFIENYGKKLASQPIQARVAQNLVFDCDLSEHIQQQIYFFGAYEKNESYLLLQVLQEGDVVIDAGGNIGFYTAIISRAVGNAGKVYSFEANTSNFEVLKNNISKNKLNNVTPINAALWNAKKKMFLNHDDADPELNRGRFYVRESEGEHKTGDYIESEVLDQFIEDRRLDCVDAIKMDIEGAELFALQGGQNLISKFRPILLLEVCDTHCERSGYNKNDLWKLFEPLDYKIYLIGATYGLSGWIKDFQEVYTNNVLLVPAEKKNIVPSWSHKEASNYFSRRI